MNVGFSYWRVCMMSGCRVLMVAFLLTAFSGVEARGLRSGNLSLGKRILNKAHPVLLGGMVFCASVVGCDQIPTKIVVPLAQNLAEVGESGTKPAIVILFGEEYEGVVGIAENGQMMAKIIGASGSPLIFLSQNEDFIGFVVPDHANLNREVEIPGMMDERMTTRYGTVTKVFDNGFYQITVTREVYDDDGSSVMPFTEYDVIAYELLTNKGGEHGGFTFTDE